MAIETLSSASTIAVTPTPDAHQLNVERITKRFVTSDGVITAVDDVSFSIAAGEFVSIIGPSGCGKSTVFNIVGGLVGDYEGRVTVAVGAYLLLKIFGGDHATPDGTCICDYIHVVDLASGHLAAVARLRGQEELFAVNLGTGKGKSVLEIVATFESASGKSIPC